ncbi:MAG: response regulator transcription factor [Bdellovibrionaceae bacterium]|nr:response regulator transcription factor [Pseudobdellovibrionaceae bacterium]
MLTINKGIGGRLSIYRILIADDDSSIRDLLSETLAHDFQVIAVENGEEAYLAAKRERPDLIILDVQMPVRDGIWATAQIRSDEATRHIPVLILSSRRTVEEKLEAYDVGADDYLEKPFTMAELRAKVQAKIRRLEERRPKNLELGNLKLSPSKMEVEVEGKAYGLSVLEVGLLSYFLQNVDTVLPRREILVHVWKDVSVSDRTVDAHIVSLRRKIADFDHEIVTVYGAGYALRKKSL